MDLRPYFSFTILSAILLFAFQNPGFSQASTGKITGFCDEALAKTQASLQKDADAKCSTMTACVPCTDRNSGISVYSTLVVQPKCNMATIQQETVSHAGDTKTQTVKDAFAVEIIQTACQKGGISFQVLFPAEAMAKAFTSPSAAKKGDKGGDVSKSKIEYSYLWEVDGKKAGHEAELTCVCGKDVSVRITASNGQKVIKKITVANCGQKNE